MCFLCVCACATEFEEYHTNYIDLELDVLDVASGSLAIAPRGTYTSTIELVAMVRSRSACLGHGRRYRERNPPSPASTAPSYHDACTGKWASPQ